MSEPVGGKRPRSAGRLHTENQALRERLTSREQALLASQRMMAEVLNQDAAWLGALEQRNRQLEAVAAVDKALAGVMDPQQVMEMALDHALEALQHPIASIYLVEGEELVLKAQRGFTPEMVAQLGRLRRGQGAAGRVLWDGKPLLVEDLALEERMRLPTTGNIRSAAVVPLKWEGRIIGTMAVSSNTVGTLTPEELNCLIALAAPVSFFIINSRQNTELREKVEELSLLTELSRIIRSSPTIEPVYESFVTKLKAIADIARAALTLVEGEQFRIVALYSEVDAPLGPQDTIPVRGSPGEWLGASGQTFYQPDLEQERRFGTDEHFLRSGIKCNIRIPLRHQAEFVGYVTLHSKNAHAYDDPRVVRLLEEASGLLAPAIANQQLYRESAQSRQGLKRYVEELERATLEAGLGWVKALETRYPSYRGHSARVAFYAARIASHLGLSEGEIRGIVLGGQLHDIGLLLVPDEEASPPGMPGVDGENRLRLHPAYGAEHLSSYPLAQQLMPIIRGHHERYDGKGYPDGLQGEAIPLSARIVAVADAYDGMVGYRMRQVPMSQEEALACLREGAGNQWDPRIVEALVQVMTSLEEIEPGAVA